MSVSVCVCVCVCVSKACKVKGRERKKERVYIHTYQKSREQLPFVSISATTCLLSTVDRDGLSTKDTCPFKYLILFDLRDRDNLSTRDKLVGPIVSLVRRFHSMYIQVIRLICSLASGCNAPVYVRTVVVIDHRQGEFS